VVYCYPHTQHVESARKLEDQRLRHLVGHTELPVTSGCHHIMCEHTRPSFPIFPKLKKGKRPGYEVSLLWCTNIVLDVLNEEGRGTEVVDREIKEALDLLVVEVHCKEMGHSCLGQHGRHQLCSDAATSTHLALLAVG